MRCAPSLAKTTIGAQNVPITRGSNIVPLAPPLPEGHRLVALRPFSRVGRITNQRHVSGVRYSLGIESSPTVPVVEPDRASALAAAATADRPLSADAEASLARAIERLPEAVTQSDAEAPTTQ